MSDNAGTHDKITALAGLPGADARSVNELFGFFARLMCIAGANMSDYITDIGAIQMCGGPRYEVLLEQCLKAGLITKTQGEDGLAQYRLLDHEDLFHIRLRAEIEQDRQRRRDTDASNYNTLLVRVRDGDECRWCGIFCQPLGRTSARSLTMDHLTPVSRGGQGTADNMVVACHGCNSARRDDVEGWAETHALRPVPDFPQYSEHTAKLLFRNGFKVRPTYGGGKVVSFEGDGTRADQPAGQPTLDVRVDPRADQPAGSPLFEMAAPASQPEDTTPQIPAASTGHANPGVATAETVNVTDTPPGDVGPIAEEESSPIYKEWSSLPESRPVERSHGDSHPVIEEESSPIYEEWSSLPESRPVERSHGDKPARTPAPGDSGDKVEVLPPKPPPKSLDVKLSVIVGDGTEISYPGSGRVINRVGSGRAGVGPGLAGPGSRGGIDYFPAPRKKRRRRNR